MNNVEFQRRELQKVRHDPKQGTPLHPDSEGQGQGLRRRWERLRIVAVGNVKGTQHELSQKWLSYHECPAEVWAHEFGAGSLVWSRRSPQDCLADRSRSQESKQWKVAAC